MDWTKPEVIVAVAAAFISAGALITSVASLVLNRRHNRAVLRPRLSFDFLIRPGSPVATVELVNRGMGPALVRTFAFHIDGRTPSEAGLHRFEEVTAHLGLPAGTVLSLLTPPESIAIGERIQLVSVPTPQYTPELAEQVRAGFRRVWYRVEYVAANGDTVFAEVGDGRRAFPPEGTVPQA